ncbi:MAG: DUF4238 domain-containing protein [Armatimonadetes bacterium]|nr:DUF4238 domain-containing protein [Armatimonadota bacterium]
MSTIQNQLSRKHHVVPRFLLAGFTDTGAKHGTLYRFDTEQITVTSGTPKAVGYIRDFYNVQTDSGQDDAYERAYGKIEDVAAPIVRRIVQTRLMPPETDMDSLIMFIASMERRSPRAKRSLDRPVNEIAQLSLEMLVVHYDEWIKSYREQNPETPPPTKKVLQTALDSGMTFESHPNLRVPLQWEAAEDIFALLRRRPWCLWTRAPDALEFICSDSPVGIDNVHKDPGFWQPPPFGEGSLVTLPISKDIALVSWFDGQQANCTNIGSQYVAMINLLTGRNSRRWLFAPRSDFGYSLDNGSIGGWADLETAIRSCRDKS